MTATYGERDIPPSTTSSGPGWVPKLPDETTLAGRLFLIRYQKGWGGAGRAGEITNVHPETWRAWESGRNQNPRHYEEIVAKIARNSGCDVGWLYGGPKMKYMIDLDRLEDALNRGLEGPVAVAFALGLHPVGTGLDQNDVKEATKRSPRLNGDSGDVTDRPTDSRPIGRPRTANLGPGPVRPQRVPRRRIA